MSTISIDWYENPTAPGQKKKERLHPRIVTFQRTTTEDVIQRIHEHSSLTVGDVRAALSGLSDALGAALREGRRVHLEGIGYFAPTLSATERVKADTRRRGAKVALKSVRFRADKELKSHFGKIHFNQTPVPDTHSENLSETEIDMRLKEYFTTHRYLTRRKFQGVCGMMRTTATRRLKQLREAGKLENAGTSNQPIYIPGRGFYGRSVQGEYEL